MKRGQALVLLLAQNELRLYWAFYAGMWYYLTLFLPVSEITFPFAVLEAAVASANVLAAPLAAGIMMLDGTAGVVSAALLMWGDRQKAMQASVCSSCTLSRSLHYEQIS